MGYEGLTTQQQRLSVSLSVFTIPFDWQAAEALLPDEDELELADALHVLVQRSKIVVSRRFAGTG